MRIHPILDTDSVNCELCSRKQSELFCKLKTNSLKALEQTRIAHYHKKGDKLFDEGMTSNWFYCINNGKVKIHKLGTEGKTRIVRLMGAGEIFGQFDMSGEFVHNYAATVLEDSIICHIPKKFLLQEINKPDLYSNLIKKLVGDISDSEESFIAFSEGNAQKKIIKALIKLYHKFGTQDDNKTLAIYLTRKEYGELIGLSTETTIRILSELRKKALIDLQNKKIIIPDIQQLERALD